MNQAQGLSIAQIAPLWHPVPPCEYGGAERIVSWLSEWLHHKGHDITLVASGDSQTAGTLVEITPSNICRLMEDGNAQNYEHYIAESIAWALRNQDRYDVIHFHVEPCWLPIISTIHTPAVVRLYTALSADDVWAINRSPSIQVVGISKDQLARSGLSLRRDIPVIYNGCDFDQIDFCDKHQGYLLFLGRMGWHKNPLGAISIAKESGMPLVLAGAPENSQEIDYFESNIRPWINGKEISHLGRVGGQQKLDLLRGAAALLFPIQWGEPFGIVMIEAMAAGTPVLGLRNGSVSEVIDNGITGFAEDDIARLALRVEEALALPRSLVRSHARKRFGVEQMGLNYERIYHEIVSKAQR